MDAHKLRPIYIGFIVILLSQTAAGCPSMCTCDGYLVKCGGIASLNGLTFPTSARKIVISGGSLPYIGPNVFGNEIEHIEFVACKIGDLQPLAFNNLHNLKTIEFWASIIKRILPCGINSISNAESIKFSNSMIEEILPGGISNVTGLTNLTITATAITSIGSFGFQNIQADRILFSDVQIETMKFAAFSGFRNIRSFALKSITSKHIEAGAFFRIRDLHRVEISGYFPVLKQHTLMELREATPGNHEQFMFEEASVSCDCFSAPLLEYIQANPEAADLSVLCATTHQPVRYVRPEQVCPDYHRESYCVQVSLMQPACSTTNTSASSLGSVTKTICPTRLNSSSIDITDQNQGQNQAGKSNKQEQNRATNSGARTKIYTVLIVTLALITSFAQCSKKFH